jgi:hypothetical protein
MTTRRKCQFDRDHGPAVATVRYTDGENRRIERALCRACADGTVRSPYAQGIELPAP